LSLFAFVIRGNVNFKPAAMAQDGQYNACKNDEIGKRRNAVMKVHSVLK